MNNYLHKYDFLNSPVNLIYSFLPSTEKENEFAYVEGTGKGPKNWGKINPHWETCGKGQMQSPIDLLDGRAVQIFPNLGKLHRDYQAAPAAVKNRGHDITVSYFFSLQYFMDLLKKQLILKTRFILIHLCHCSMHKIVDPI